MPATALILCVGGDPRVTGLRALVLKSAGVRTRLAEDLEEALALAEDTHFDGAIIDRDFGFDLQTMIGQAIHSVQGPIPILYLPDPTTPELLADFAHEVIEASNAQDGSITQPSDDPSNPL